jgi:glucose-1-phosphate adenylyltransferase
MNGLQGIIFSYEKRNDLRELADIRTASSMPFGGRYRAVDFSLSSMVNAGITDVGVVLHGRYQSMLDHLGTGKSWDLSRKRGGLQILPPQNDQDNWGILPFRGKMEALAGVRSYLDCIRHDNVVLMEGDLVANLPLADIYASHLRSGADITVVCGNDSFAAQNGTYFELDATGRVTDVMFNLHMPRGYRGLEVYILSTELLREMVDDCTAHDQHSFRRDVLQARKQELHIGSYIWGGFAAQIRSVREYYDRSMQLLDPAIRKELFTLERPIRAKGSDKSSAYIAPAGCCVNSLVADGCNIAGQVENSILFPGVRVEEGAVVRNSILFKETAVRKNARLSYVIADKRVEVLEKRTLMGSSTYPLVIAKGSQV